MRDTTVERTVTEKIQDFAALMEKIATLEPQQQEKITFFVQGYVAGSSNGRKTIESNEVGSSHSVERGE